MYVERPSLALLGAMLLFFASLAHAVSPSSPQLLLQGRFTPGPDSDGFGTLPQTFSWAASRISFNIAVSSGETTALTLSFANVPAAEDQLSVTNLGGVAATIFEILVDGTPAKTCAVGPSGAQCTVPELQSGNYTITVAKIAEPLGGEATLTAIIPSAPSFTSFGPVTLPPAIKSGRRMQFIGASFTVGLGVLGNATCGVVESITDLEDTFLAWGPLAADYFEADYQVIAWSGAGAVTTSTVDLQKGGFGSSSKATSPAMPPSAAGRRLLQQVTMPSDVQLFGRAVAGDPTSVADLASWVPQIVVFAAGVNDYVVGMGEDAWVEGYVAFVQNVSAVYDNPDIILMAVSNVPALSGGPGSVNQGKPAEGESTAGYQSDMARVFTELEMQGVENVYLLELDASSIPTDEVATWCQSHPNAAAHELFAEQLEVFINAVLPDWSTSTYPMVVATSK